MQRTAFVVLTALLLLTGCNPNAKDQAAGEKDKKEPAAQGVVVSAEEAAHIGLSSQPVLAAQFLPVIKGYGVVIGLDTIAQSQAELATSAAAATQTEAALARARRLSRNTQGAISSQELETAARTAASDSAALALARGKAAAMFGKDAPWLKPGGGAVMSKLTSGTAVLIHVSFTQGAPGDRPQTLQFTSLNGGAARKAVSSSTIWDAPADPAIPGRSFYAIVQGSDFAQGERVDVTAPASAGVAQNGVVVPREAVVLSDNLAWYYVRAKDGSYVRKQLDLNKSVQGGYFVQKDIGPGDVVVTSGAGLLLAHELNPSTEPEE